MIGAISALAKLTTLPSRTTAPSRPSPPTSCHCQGPTSRHFSGTPAASVIDDTVIVSSGLSDTEV